jgi:glucose/mannose-6-phosphate isomerase
MLGLVRGLPDQLAAAERLPGLAGLQPLPARPTRVMVCGMGGSAVAGDLAAPLVAAAGHELLVQRDYVLPRWVGPETLIVISSYSGDTAEVLAACTEAGRRGCPRLALAAGGELARLATEARFPLIALPPELPPRAAIGHSLGGLLWGLHRLGLLASPAADLAAALGTLREGNERLLPRGAPSPLAPLAAACRDAFVVVFTTSPETHGPGLRLKAQLNENAKCPSCVAAFPELDHNEIVGWELPPARRDGFVLIVLRGDDELAQTSRRVAVTLELLAGQFAAIHQEQARGGVALARILSLVQFADHLSCEVAAARGVDPMPVARIDRLKEALQKGTCP